MTISLLVFLALTWPMNGFMKPSKCGDSWLCYGSKPALDKQAIGNSLKTWPEPFSQLAAQQDKKSKSWWWQEEPAVDSRLVWSSSFVRSNYNNRWSSASPSNPRRDISTGSSGKWARWLFSGTNMIMRWILDGAQLQGGQASLAVG